MKATAIQGRSARGFLGGLLARSLFLLVATACLNFLVNPFGVYPIHLFEPIAMGSRGPKLSLYQRRAPAIVVLG